jgi:hypothetical protein
MAHGSNNENRKLDAQLDAYGLHPRRVATWITPVHDPKRPMMYLIGYSPRGEAGRKRAKAKLDSTSSDM